MMYYHFAYFLHVASFFLRICRQNFATYRGTLRSRPLPAGDAELPAGAAASPPPALPPGAASAYPPPPWQQPAPRAAAAAPGIHRGMYSPSKINMVIIRETNHTSMHQYGIRDGDAAYYMTNGKAANADTDLKKTDVPEVAEARVGPRVSLSG